MITDFFFKMFMGTTMFLPRVIVFHQDHAAFMVT